MGDKTLRERMARVEVKVSRIEIVEKDVKEILENHPHPSVQSLTVALCPQKLELLVVAFGKLLRRSG